MNGSSADGERRSPAPVPLLLYCPACGLQHVDAPDEAKNWSNPPHRSHECQGCGHVWRPADVATVGVAEIRSCGRLDRSPVPVTAALAAQLAALEPSAKPGARKKGAA